MRSKKISGNLRSFLGAGLLALLGLGATGCIPEYDFERPQYQRGTLGEELFGIWHKDAKRAAEQPEQKTEMLERRRTEFVTSVDTIAPSDKLSEVDEFLQDVMSLIDDGLVQSLTRKVRIALAQAAEDDGLIAALAIQGRPHPEDFLSPINGKNFIGHLMAYPRLPEVATRTTDILLAADGVDRQGNEDNDESTALADLMGSLTHTLRDASHIDSRDTLAYSFQQVLVTQDPRFAPPAGGPPNFAVAYDHRGYPKVKKTSTGVQYPFVDEDDDGLADVDAQGRFVLSTGDSRDVPAFRTRTNQSALLNRDEYGRGSTAGGDYTFEYIDLNETGLHFVTRQVGELTNSGLLWNVVDTAPAVLGTRVPKTDDRGSFAGYSADNPITDVFYALFHILDIAPLDEVLDSTADFLDRNSSELAGVIFALDEASELIDQYPNAQLEENQTIAYDLLPLLEELSADPDLWRDFFWALRQPTVRRTGQAMQTLLEHRNQNPSIPAIDGPYDSCFKACKQRYQVFADYTSGSKCADRYDPQAAIARYECIRSCPQGEIFSEPMDFDAPESLSNRSMMQRLFHLLRDTAGTPYALNITQPGWLGSLPPIVELPGAAEAFIRSVGGELDLADFVPDLGALQPLVDLIGGNSSVASILSTLSPIFGTKLDRRATPDQITRLFNQPELSGSLPFVGTIAIDPPVCKDGYVMANHHADILYASEASGLIETIRPLSCAFALHGREELFAQMFSILHEHYSGRTDLYREADGGASPMKGSNFRSYEPAVRDILARGTLFDALYDLSIAADRFKSDTGIDFVEQLRLLVYNATRSDDGFTGRNGESMVNLSDGRTVRELSRTHILLEAAGELDRAVENDPQADAALSDILSSLYGVLLGTQWPDGERARFEKPGGIALLSKLTRHLSVKAKEAREANRLSEWVTTDQMDNVYGVWDSRALPALVDLSEELASSEENRELTEDLVNYLLGGPDGRDQASMAAYVLMVYSLHQDLWVPLSHFLGTVVDPARQWDVESYSNLPLTSHILYLLRDTVERDPDGLGLEMFERGFTNRDDGSVPFLTIFGIVADYFRVDPASTAPYTAEDYRKVFEEFAAWLGDDVHGMEQLYDIVGTRVGE